VVVFISLLSEGIRTILIIEIDGYFINAFFVCERYINHQELIINYRETREICSKTEEIPVLLKELLNLREIQKYEGLKVDFVIDTDTDRIYKPRY
jgi:hypothetical protein